MDADALRLHIQEDLRSQGDEVEIGLDDDLTLAGLDSIGFIRLIDHIEQTTGVKIPPETVTLENFGSVGKIEAFVASRLPSS